MLYYRDICTKLATGANPNSKEWSAAHYGMQAGATDVATWLRAQAAHLGPFLSTVLLLMAELAQKDASPLRPWLCALPDSHDCVLAWSSEERTALEGGEGMLAWCEQCSERVSTCQLSVDSSAVLLLSVICD